MRVVNMRMCADSIPPHRSLPLADVAELADALDSGSSESNFIWVQVPSSAPKKSTIFDRRLSIFLSKTEGLGM